MNVLHGTEEDGEEVTESGGGKLQLVQVAFANDNRIKLLPVNIIPAQLKIIAFISAIYFLITL